MVLNVALKVLLPLYSSTVPLGATGVFTYHAIMLYVLTRYRPKVLLGQLARKGQISAGRSSYYLATYSTLLLTHLLSTKIGKVGTYGVLI